jgi:membrane-bound lytic murein transglycosylase C
VGGQPTEAKQNIQKQLETITNQVDSTNVPVLKELLPENTDKVLEDKNITASTAEKIIGKDGIARLKFLIKISMVPDHLQRRVERYFPKISLTAQEQGVDPALVLAVMHSESYFNPFARSSVPAFGLMQIVPKYAGKDAYKELFGTEKVLTPEYLYNADNNILLGVTYLKLLNYKYFQDINNSEKRRFIIVCAYNWGPTAMRNRFVKKSNVSDLSNEDLFALLLKKVPKETHDYLIRVENRRKMYQKTIDLAEVK